MISLLLAWASRDRTMNSRRSALVAWFALGWFGVVSTVGQGLHCLPGMGHSGHTCSGCCRPSLGVWHMARGESGCHVADDSDPGCRAAHNTGSGWLCSEREARGSGRCPICDFFASAKGVVPPALPVLTTLRVAARPLSGHVDVVAAVAVAYDVRAPPVG